MYMPTRIAIVRRYGIEVSDDGFTPTPDGPVHIDDSKECKALIRHNLIQQAADRMVDDTWHSLRLAGLAVDRELVRALAERQVGAAPPPDLWPAADPSACSLPPPTTRAHRHGPHSRPA